VPSHSAASTQDDCADCSGKIGQLLPEQAMTSMS
jgi:hypothetical protein